MEFTKRQNLQISIADGQFAAAIIRYIERQLNLLLKLLNMPLDFVLQLFVRWRFQPVVVLFISIADSLSYVRLQGKD